MPSSSKVLIIIFLAYPIIETIILELHRTEYLNFIPNQLLLLFDYRDTFVMNLSQSSLKSWNFLSPILIPILWAITLKLISIPGFLKPRFGIKGPMIVISVLGAAWMVVIIMGSCWEQTSVRGVYGGCARYGGVWDCNQGCVRALFSAGFGVVLVVATWVGVDWDAGLVEWLMALGERSVEDVEKG